MATASRSGWGNCASLKPALRWCWPNAIPDWVPRATGRCGQDTVRDVIHRFNEIGLACLDPQWAGGRPRLLNRDDEDFVVQTATTRPTKLGQPFTRWSLRKLVAYLRKVHGRVIRIGREALRGLLARRGVTFQRTKTWKESPAPDREAKLDRIVQIRPDGIRRPRRFPHPFGVSLLLNPDFLVQGIAQLVGGALEFAQALAEGAAQFREFPGAENDEGDRQDDDQLRHPDRTEHIANP